MIDSSDLEPASWDGMVVIASGMSWDEPWMSEKHLAIALGVVEDHLELGLDVVAVCFGHPNLPDT